MANPRYGVVGAGLIGSLFKEIRGFDVVHRHQWQPVRWDGGLVNCAGIIGREICEATPFAQVLGANVRMPLKMFEMCRGQDVPFITFSSSTVYAKPKQEVDLVLESDSLFPHDAYSASKILMESLLPHDQCFIFRIPRVVADNGHPNDFCEKVKGWKVCEDVYRSVIYPETIIKAVKRALTDPSVPRGIYNLASDAVHLPTFVRNRYGWEGEIVEAYSLGYYPEVILNCDKANEAGLISKLT